jgi:small subunit ribosomal protein S1
VDETEATPTSISELRPKMRLRGVVKETQLYGAVIDIGLERDGLAHISQLAPRRVGRVTDVVKQGDEVTVWVTKVEEDKGRIGLSLVEPPEVDWNDINEGDSYSGKVTRMEKYGAFVDIGAEKPGLLHVREMSDAFVRHPSDIVHMGETLQVHVLKVDRRKRRIDLTLRGTEDEVDLEEAGLEEEEEVPQKTAMEIALQRASAGDQPQRKRRRRSKKGPDLSEREAILARTLQRHSEED